MIEGIKSQNTQLFQSTKFKLLWRLRSGKHFHKHFHRFPSASSRDFSILFAINFIFSSFQYLWSDLTLIACKQHSSFCSYLVFFMLHIIDGISGILFLDLWNCFVGISLKKYLASFKHFGTLRLSGISTSQLIICMHDERTHILVVHFFIKLIQVAYYEQNILSMMFYKKIPRKQNTFLENIIF